MNTNPRQANAACALTPHPPHAIGAWLRPVSPHPGPLPRGEGELPAVSWRSESGAALRLPAHSNRCAPGYVPTEPIGNWHFSSLIWQLPLLAAALLALTATVRADPLGTVFTYQGRLLEGGAPANGSYDLSLLLFDAATNGAQIYMSQEFTALAITNGLFTLPLDFGPVAFTGGARWLEIRVRTHGVAGDYRLLTPRQLLTPAPYALYSPNAGLASTATTANVATTANSVANNAVSSSSIANGQVVRSLNGQHDDLTLVAGANATLTPGAQMLTVSTPTDWHVAGNAGTTPGLNFLGTTDNQPLEFRVNGQRALHLEPGGSNSVNVAGGWSGNTITAGVAGATIAGGGAGNYYGVPVLNCADADLATIGGGGNNTIAIGAWYATISGGYGNIIATNSAAGVIGGGSQNSITGANDMCSIGGGGRNKIMGNAERSTISGGDDNRIEGGSGLPAPFSSTIAGGRYNQITASELCAIGGGYQNHIETNVSCGTIGGGYVNLATNAYATIGGGSNNLAGGVAATVGGGLGNVALGDAAFVGGGARNWTYDVCATIGGGQQNFASYPYATIGGGFQNVANNSYSTVGGGNDNWASGAFATVPGGVGNRADGQWSFAAGHRAKTSSAGSFVWGDSSSPDIWAMGDNQFVARATGGFWFITAVDINGVPTCQAYLGPCSPSWSITSDRNQKENFKPVDHRALLEKLVQMPVTEWTMKGEKPGIQHLGPVAQDFHAAFGLGGADDRHIVSSDETGVALAAIQGLNQKLEEELKHRDAENAELKRRLAQLEHLVNALTQQRKGGDL